MLHMSTVEKKKNPNRPITGLLSSTYTAQHAILSLSLLFLLLSPASAQPPPNGAVPQQYQRFTPSMAIIIVILIAALFIMGFFSIYIRRCSENADGSISRLGALGASIRGRRAAAARGLDPAVIETFPTFVYSVVKGLKIGNGALECAVCLNEFEDDETLRLIPKCDHVFHPECIDAWLESHVTCPVCRANLVPQPGETIQVFPDLNTESEPDNPQNNDDVSIRISDDHDVSEQEPPPPVVRRNLSSNQNRPPRSRSVRSMLFGKFPRSHSTGHSLVQPGENMDRFTLRLPEDLRKEVMNRRLNRTTSCVVVLPRETSSRRGYRTGGGEGSRNYRQLEPPLDRGVRSDRWVFSMAPPFFSRASSVRSPKGVVAATSSTTPKGSVTAVKTPFNFLEPKGDESGVESARHPV